MKTACYALFVISVVVCTAAFAVSPAYVRIKDADFARGYVRSRVATGETHDFAAPASAAYATNMVLHLADGATQTLPLSSLQKMFFASESAAIEAVAQGEQKVRFSNGMLRADLQAGEAVTLFNMKGEQEFSTNKSGTYDLKHLAKGVYIVKVGQESKKIINK